MGPLTHPDVSQQRSTRREGPAVAPSSRYAFYALLAVLFALAVGHLYALRGLTDLYLGLPLWVWLQVGVVAVMLAVARAAVRIVTAETGRGTGDGTRDEGTGDGTGDGRRGDAEGDG